jgi:Phage integrase family
MLDTCCRPGEILSLQWRDVDLELRQLTIRAEKAKTRRERRLPISRRLLAVLQIRQCDPAGEPFGPEAFVFGDEVGRQAKSIRTAWENARDAAGLGDFHLADVRHEAASRFEEAGVPTTYSRSSSGTATSPPRPATSTPPSGGSDRHCRSSRRPGISPRLQTACKNGRTPPDTARPTSKSPPSVSHSFPKS